MFQLFDALVVMLSLAAEIVLFLLHDKLLCYHVATEAVAFIVILRLWKLPRTCDSKYLNRLNMAYNIVVLLPWL